MWKPVHGAVGTSLSATQETVGDIPSRAVRGLLKIFRGLALTSLPVSPQVRRAEPSRAEPSRAEPSRAATSASGLRP